MRTTMTILRQWYWYLLVLLQNIPFISSDAQFMDFCNKVLNMPSSSSSSIQFTKPSIDSLCCNITVRSDYSEQTIIDIYNLTMDKSPLKISNKQNSLIKFTDLSSTTNRIYWKSEQISFPIYLNLCQFNLPLFEILFTDPNKDTTAKMIPQKIERTFRGGFVTTTIVIGLLLIICSVSIALAFVYFQRKRQRRRQFTYSLESTSDDWEPTGLGTGYHLFDNWRHNRRHTENQVDNLIIDANEHLPITTNMTTNR